MVPYCQKALLPGSPVPELVVGLEFQQPDVPGGVPETDIHVVGAVSSVIFTYPVLYRVGQVVVAVGREVVLNERDGPVQVLVLGVAALGSLLHIRHELESVIYVLVWDVRIKIKLRD